mmetsp:Transcript_22444/g.29112  ORF Transcript_22444/g.29112 Transcript_22444/m.29112 type:complete len:95 (+) Transcript_22444:3-287(+)
MGVASGISHANKEKKLDAESIPAPPNYELWPATKRNQQNKKAIHSRATATVTQKLQNRKRLGWQLGVVAVTLQLVLTVGCAASFHAVVWYLASA